MKGFPTQVHYEGYTRELALQSVGAGWSSLIHEIFDALETKFKNIKVIQVKEKWGGLRVYTDHSNENLDKIIIEVERKSFIVCEDCGEAGLLREGDWHRTLCETHAAGKKAIKPF
jgi:hypothetical protein